MQNQDFAADIAGIDRAVALAEESDEPALRPAGDLTIDLPGGYIDEQRKVHRQAVIREMNGFDEEAMAHAMKSTKPMAFLDEALRRCVVQIGEHEVNERMLDNLLVGDRNWLIIGIRRATYGDEWETGFTCPKCKSDSDVIFDLASDFDMKTVDSPIIEFELSKSGSKVKARFPNGEDQKAMMGSSQGTTIPEVNSILLSRCLLEVDGEEVIDMAQEPEQFVRSMSTADRREAIREITLNQPGPDLGEVKFPCASCGQETLVALDVARFL